MQKVIRKTLFYTLIFIIMSCTHSKKTGVTDLESDMNCNKILAYSWHEFSIDQDFNKYLSSMTKEINLLNSSEIKDISGMDSKACGKALITACLINQHSAIDSVTITPSCRGVSYRFKENQTWGNVIVE